MIYTTHFSYPQNLGSRRVGFKDIWYEQVSRYHEGGYRVAQWWLYRVMHGDDHSEYGREIFDKYGTLIWQIHHQKKTISETFRLAGAEKLADQWVLELESNVHRESRGWGNVSLTRDIEIVFLRHDECPLPDFFGREPTPEDVKDFDILTRMCAAVAYGNPKLCLAKYSTIDVNFSVRDLYPDHNLEILANAITDLGDHFKETSIPKKYWAGIAQGTLGVYHADLKATIYQFEFVFKRQQSLATEYISTYGAYNTSTVLCGDFTLFTAMAQKHGMDILRTALGLPNKFSIDNKIEVSFHTLNEVRRFLNAYDIFQRSYENEQKKKFWMRWMSPRRTRRTIKEFLDALADMNKKEVTKEPTVDTSPKLPRLPLPDKVMGGGVEFEVYQCPTMDSKKRLGFKFMNCLRDGHLDYECRMWSEMTTPEKLRNYKHKMKHVIALIPKTRGFKFKEYAVCIALDIGINGEAMSIYNLVYQIEIMGVEAFLGVPNPNTQYCSIYRNAHLPSESREAVEALYAYLADPPSPSNTAPTSVEENEPQNNPAKQPAWRVVGTY